jgi:hypothetical protein
MIPMIAVLIVGMVWSILMALLSGDTIIHVVLIFIDFYNIAIVFSLYRNFTALCSNGFCAHYQQSIAWNPLRCESQNQNFIQPTLNTQSAITKCKTVSEVAEVTRITKS